MYSILIYLFRFYFIFVSCAKERTKTFFFVFCFVSTNFYSITIKLGYFFLLFLNQINQILWRETIFERKLLRNTWNTWNKKPIASQIIWHNFHCRTFTERLIFIFNLDNNISMSFNQQNFWQMCNSNKFIYVQFTNDASTIEII